MAGRSAAAAPTRYAGIQVQTSALGVQVPVVWGTARCKCNLVDYLDFKSTAQTAAGGKGGQVTGYAYAATLILGVCEGPIANITQVWVDGKTFAFGSVGSGVANTGSTSALAQAGLSISTGAVGQAPWSYLTSHHPDHAIGYSGLCIVYAANYQLDSSAGTPQHSFEVVSNFTISGLPDANPSVVLTDFFGNARYGLPNWASGLLDATSFAIYSTYCLAQNLLISAVLDEARSASDFLSEVMAATNSDLLWSEGLLKIVVFGDTTVSGNGATFTPSLTPVYSLTDDHFVPKSDGEDALTVDIADQSDAYNIVQLEYLDRTNQYATSIATANDAANISQYGRRKKDPTTVHVICDPKVAQAAAQLYLQRTLYVRKQYKFTLDWRFALLEPGDIVTLTHTPMGLTAYAARIIQIDEQEDGLLEITAEDLLAGIGHAPLYATQTGAGAQPNRNIDPGGVEANLLSWSGDATNAVWAKTGLSIVANAAADQYGLTTADELVPSVTTGQHALAQTISTFADCAYAFSVCLQAGAHAKYRVSVLDSGGTNGGYVEVDVSAGVVTTPATDVGAGVVLSSSIVASLATGIWIVSIVVQTPSATSLRAVVNVLSAAGALVWTGDNSAAGYVSQPSLRQGVAAGAYAATSATAAGPLIFSAPSVLASGGAEVWAAVAGGPNWGGANIWVSADDVNYQFAATASQPARFGQATSTLPYGGNLLRYSTDLTNTTWWGLGNATVAGGATDPFGGSTAITWTRTASGDAFIFQPMQGDGSGKTFTFSVYLKLGTLAGAVKLKIQDSVIPVVYGTATVTPTGAWARYWVTATFGANSAAGVTCLIEPASAGSAGETLLIASPQNEYGATPNNYAPSGAEPISADPDVLYPLSLDLGASNADLDSATQTVADASGTLCLIDGELIAYETATLTAPNQYTLGTYIRRGVLSTPIASHAVGASFVRLDGSTTSIPFDATQAGKKLYVKFQSFNAYGQSLQDLANCIAYSVVPVPVAGAGPAPTAWTAVGTTLSNSGQSIPAIVVTGASDNPSATSIEFDYRVTGTATWASAGAGNNATTRKEITSVQAGQAYDVSVLYLVNGVASNREVIASGVTVGAVSTSSGGAAPGAVLLNDSAPGSGKTFTCPAGSYAHVDIVLTGFAGAGSGVSSGKGGASTDYGGGGGAASVSLSFAVTPGTTAFTYTIASGVGSSATCTATGLSMSAGSGANATPSGPGAGGAASGGTTNNYPGHNGGLTDTWDGGGAADAGGHYADNTSDNSPGAAPGQAGAGSWIAPQPGGGANLLIVARA